MELKRSYSFESPNFSNRSPKIKDYITFIIKSNLIKRIELNGLIIIKKSIIESL